MEQMTNTKFEEYDKQKSVKLTVHPKEKRLNVAYEKFSTKKYNDNKK